MDIHTVCLDTFIERNSKTAGRWAATQVGDSQAKVLCNCLQLVGFVDMTHGRSFILLGSLRANRGNMSRNFPSTVLCRQAGRCASTSL